MANIKKKIANLMWLKADESDRLDELLFLNSRESVKGFSEIKASLGTQIKECENKIAAIYAEINRLQSPIGSPFNTEGI